MSLRANLSGQPHSSSQDSQLCSGMMRLHSVSLHPISMISAAQVARAPISSSQLLTILLITRRSRTLIAAACSASTWSSWLLVIAFIFLTPLEKISADEDGRPTIGDLSGSARSTGGSVLQVDHCSVRCEMAPCPREGVLSHGRYRHHRNHAH